MCTEEGGYYAIKGFLYQYDKTIIEILSRKETEYVYIEHIQDIDCENYVLQVKHKETAKYSNSSIREPVIKLLNIFIANTSKKFCLYVYFKDQKPHSVKYNTIQELKNILKYRDENKTKILQAQYTDEQLTQFIQHFTLQFAEDYDGQYKKVIQLLSERMGINEEEAWIYHAIILEKLFAIALEDDDEKRRISYQQVKEHVDKCTTVTFENKYRILIGKEKFLSAIKKRYFTFNKPNINNFERLFLIECSAIENETVLRYIVNFLKNKYYKPGKSPAPYICFRGLDKNILNEVKRGMIDNNEMFSDGTYFDGDKFRKDKLAEDKKSCIKFISEEYLYGLGIVFKEIYEFYRKDKLTVYDNSYRIEVQIESLEDVRSLLT